MDRTLAVKVAGAPTSAVEGMFERHVSLGVRGLVGSAAGGRWGPSGAFPVLYLGRPVDSIVVEAYRHLVDDIEGMRPEAVGPRRLLTAEVRVSTVLDLRSAASLAAVGLTMDDLEGPHGPCQAVGLAAHQLGLHGVVAPAATGFGETLALFERHLPADEVPTLVGEVLWERLPADPRVLRLIEDQRAGREP